MANIYGNEAATGSDFFKTAGEGDSSEGDAPVIRLVTNLLMEAFKTKASDIHIEPLEKDIRIRYRIDGVLHDVEHHPKRLLAAIISRIKIMTGTMSIDEKRVPQDGRITMSFNDKELDMRVSIVPTNNGESVVMRVLDKSSLRLGLSDLGFLSDDQSRFERLLTLPDGIILVTGPTGSGKTTTLYACLNFINRPDRKIITVEDPVEYELAGINQVMVKEDIGIDLRLRAARHAASGTEHHHDRGNSRYGDGGYRHPSIPDRPPCLQYTRQPTMPLAPLPVSLISASNPS